MYDVAIIGSGPGGYTAAIRGGEYGLKVALIEKDPKLGGTCLHVGCIPTKALLFNAEIWDHLQHAEEFGIDGVGAPKLNWQAIQKRKNDIVAKHAKGLDFLMRKNKVEVIRGFGKIAGAPQQGVLNLVVAAGSAAKMLPGLQTGERILTNIEILSLNAIPKSLVVIGAGAVGVEFASIFRSFGSEISIVEYLPRLVPVEDEDVSKELARSFRKRGIDANTGAKVEKVEKTKSGVKVTFTASDGKQVVKEAEKVLVAVGRAPRTEGIGLEKTKIAPEKGFIK